MPRLPVDDVLRRIERHVAPRPEFADELLAAFLRELELEPETHEEPRPGAPRLRRRGIRRAGRLAAAAAAILVTIVAIVVIVVPSSRETALGVIEQAQQDFAQVPSFHATWSRHVSGDSEIFDEFPNDHNGEDWVQVQEFWYDGTDGWRMEIVEDTLPFIRGGAGTFAVFDGERTGIYRADENTAGVAEGERVEFSPLLELSPEPTGGVGKLIQTRAGGGMPFNTYFEQRCQTLPDDRVAGRGARHLTCEDGFQQLWLDADTGLILRYLNPEFELQVEALEYEPKFSPGLFEFQPPAEAEKPGEADQLTSDLVVGEVVPVWSGSLLGGGQFDLQALRGKPTVVYYWASWCPPCIGRPLDDLEGAYKERRDDLNFVSVSYDSENATRNFLDEEGPYRLPIVLDEEGVIARQWGIEAIPWLVLLDEDLQIQGAFRGSIAAQDLRSLLDALAEGEPLPKIDREDG